VHGYPLPTAVSYTRIDPDVAECPGIWQKTAIDFNIGVGPQDKKPIACLNNRSEGAV